MKKYIFLLFLLATSSQAFSKQIKLSVDWAAFRYDDKQLFVEIYYGFLQPELHYIEKGEKFAALTLARLEVFQNNTPFKDFSWKNQNVIDNLNMLDESKPVIDQVGFVFAPGAYNFKLIVRDLNSPENADSVTWNMTLPPPLAKNAYLSDVELASSIRKGAGEKSSPFYKNTLIVEPNPSLVFARDIPALFFYAEAYNLPNRISQGGYQLKYYVTSVNGAQINEVMAKKVNKAKAVHPSVEFGVLNVGKLPTGSYKLHVEILDSANRVVTQKEKKFYIFQKDEELARQNFFQSGDDPMLNVFQQMDSTQIENELHMIYYLLDKNMRKLISQISILRGKRMLLYRFWKDRDPDPETPQNEFRDEYLKRLDYANRNFRAFKLPGWRTDRGRVYMVYGPPSDVERHPNEPNLYPYEIWYYHELQNGVKFIFADLDGQGNYRLLHSDLVGEIQDYGYMDILRKGYR